jgi:hypothetical protein
VATSERHGLRPSLARGHLAVASLLAGRGDPVAAREEARRALAVAQDVGMARVAQAAREVVGR